MVIRVGRPTPYYNLTSHHIHHIHNSPIHLGQGRPSNHAARRTPHADASKKSHGGTLPYPYSRQRINRFTVPQAPTTLTHFRPPTS